MGDSAAQNKSLIKIWCKSITNVVSVKVMDEYVCQPKGSKAANQKSEREKN